MSNGLCLQQILIRAHSAHFRFSIKTNNELECIHEIRDIGVEFYT